MAKESMTATRVTMVGIRSRDLLWMFTVCTIVNIAMLYLISSGATSVYLPMTVMIVLVNILTILGMIDASIIPRIVRILTNTIITVIGR